MHITQQMYDFWDLALQSVVLTKMSVVLLALNAAVGTFWLVHFTFRSFSWMWQGMTSTFQEVFFEILKVAFICGCAFNVQWYWSTIVPVITGFPSWMGGVLSGQDGSQMNQIDSMVVVYLENLNKLFDIFKVDLWDVDLKTIYLGGQALVIYLIAGVPFMLTVSGTIVVLKAASTVITAVGPLFIVFALFAQTKQWFWGWVSVMAGFMLTQVLFAAVIALELSFINSYIIVNGKIDLSLTGNFVMLLCFSAFTLLAVELPNYAATIMGGTPVSATGIGGIIAKGSGLGSAMNSARAAKSIGEKIAAKIKGRNKIS
ncbi:type IV secretion system protein [Pseudomonas syringae pv. syringae]|uniref:VirB6 n=1 Tax=Pseudomonas syringae pv. syringae TaxID=321 RepID=A0A1S6YBK5_PSESY|nr:type IV secretion system protein [Pseudomonas syringae]AQX42227.1 VirB6 [Pseudomonas syringae pv. syringae]MCK9764875.1 type IV secretion system protein [Pseudomonas syringae pv. syringae]